MEVVHFSITGKPNTLCYRPKDWLLLTINEKIVTCDSCIRHLNADAKKEETMSECKLCGTQLPASHPAVILAELETWVKSKGGWDIFESEDTRYGLYPVGKEFSVGNRFASVADKKMTPGYPPNGYDGAYEQGTEFEVYVIIKVGEQYFKKSGSADSYGEVSWDGDLKTVQPREKTVTYYE